MVILLEPIQFLQLKQPAEQGGRNICPDGESSPDKPELVNT